MKSVKISPVSTVQKLFYELKKMYASSKIIAVVADVRHRKWSNNFTTTSLLLLYVLYFIVIYIFVSVSFCKRKTIAYKPSAVMAAGTGNNDGFSLDFIMYIL